MHDDQGTNPAPGAGWRWDHSYTKLPALLYSRCRPVPVEKSKLAIFNRSLAVSLGLNPAALENRADIFAGKAIPDGSEPIAQAYAGHQFGHFTSLGDGRAILLGEHLAPGNLRFDIQLKGSGRTPYSRGGDGRATLGPMLREYIISEAMHALGIPTTRSLAVAATGEEIYRQEILPGAVLTRIAASHIRVGTFQHVAALEDIPALRALADHTLQRHFPELAESGSLYFDFFKAVMERQATLIAKWLHVGFIHGVMNTDNMALSGETIDYGPCAFMDNYDPETVFSSIDRHGRYAYDKQPQIARWNLARLAEAMLPLFHADRKIAVDLANEALGSFEGIFQNAWLSGMRSKLGIFTEEKEDAALVQDLLDWMRSSHLDFTNTFHMLSDCLTDGRDRSPQRSGEWTANDSVHVLHEKRSKAGHSLTILADRPEVDPYLRSEFIAWQEKWTSRLTRQPQSSSEAAEIMRAHNPSVIPRNHKVEEALSAAVEHRDMSVTQRLLEVLANPYSSNAPLEYTSPPPPGTPAYQTFCGT